MKLRFIELKNGAIVQEATYYAVIKNINLLLQTLPGQIALNEFQFKTHNNKYPVSTISKKHLLEYSLIQENGEIYKDIKAIVECTLAIKNNIHGLVNGVKNVYEVPYSITTTKTKAYIFKDQTTKDWSGETALIGLDEHTESGGDDMLISKL